MVARAPGPYKPVDPPVATPPLHGLVASARKIVEDNDVPDAQGTSLGATPNRRPGGRWEMGFQFLPETCMHVYAWAPECALTGAETPPGKGVNKNAPDTAIDPVQELPFTLYTRFQCATAGMQSRNDQGRAKRALEAGTSKALEDELWSDHLGLGNFSLVRSTPNIDATANAGVLNPGGAAAPVAKSSDYALAALTQALAGAGAGSRGMIHAPVFLAQLWATHSFLDNDGPRLVTKARGDIIVAGSGYPWPGTGPGGTAAPAGTTWVYATSLIEVRLGEIAFLADDDAQAVDRDHNTITTTAERTVAAVTDLCAAFAFLVTLPA